MEKTDLIREIIELQRKVDRARRQYQLDIWMGLSITIAQLKSLFFISNQGSTSLGKLATALGVTSTNTTGIGDGNRHGCDAHSGEPQFQEDNILRSQPFYGRVSTGNREPEIKKLSIERAHDEAKKALKAFEEASQDYQGKAKRHIYMGLISLPSMRLIGRGVNLNKWTGDSAKFTFNLPLPTTTIS